MTAVAASEMLNKVFEYPLFDALCGRRSRRFGLGFEMTEGPYRSKSPHAAVPLSETEEALLVAAGAGISGLPLWDLSRPSAYRAGGARTFPSTLPSGRRTVLFFTNDKGVYVIDATRVSASKPREIEGSNEREKVLALYRDHRKVLAESRLDIPRRMPPMCGHNLWDSNAPGSTLFMPVCDVTVALISLMIQFVDPALGRFTTRRGRGTYIVDDRYGFRPAGTERWLRDGFLDGENVLTLLLLERQVCYFTFSELAAMCQNIFLRRRHLGSEDGCTADTCLWRYSGAWAFELSLTTRQRCPTRSVWTGSCKPVVRPYYPTMDAAVDAVLGPLSGENSPTGPVPFVISEAEHRAGTVAPSDEGIACTKAICNYVLDTYGRFPGSIDAMHLMWFMQAHHIDTDFYDRFFSPGAYGQTQAGHMARWHP